MDTVRETAIAVVGMACRFPGAPNYEAFWENLRSGKSHIEEVPANRWDWKAFWGDPLTEKNKSNSKWGGFLKDADCFDADFFGLSAREVERMDPQQRIMLELTWLCLEDAGIRPSRLSGKKVGVYLGVFNFDYKELQERNSHLSIEAHHSTGTASAIIANRISYYFNFRGPSFPIDTACSSSLNAVHAAVQSLQRGECTVALAGGVNLLLTPTRHISFSKTGMLSPTGSCKTFDDTADGYVRGEGAGLVLLKPLEDALRDNDQIYGVIRGTAINHGGKTYSLTYPNQDAQQEVIMEAQRAAGVSAHTISYVEAHGTGTPKGDPIEFQALTGAFTLAQTEEIKRTSYCALSSVKTNIGHLEAAAGIAGLIKVLLCMKHKQIAALQNFKQLNHRISLENSPFFLATQLTDWQPLTDEHNNKLPRRAGVSSFGFGGTNAHVVLEEVPAMPTEQAHENIPPFYMVCLSAKSSESLHRKEEELAAWLTAAGNSIQLADVCKTLSAGREHFQQRTVLIADSIQQLKDKLLAGSDSRDGFSRNIQHDKKQAPIQPLFREMAEMITGALASNGSMTREEYYQKLTILAELYLKGYEPDWNQPWFGSHGRVIGLPGYPFVRNHYWLPDLQDQLTGSAGSATTIAQHGLQLQNRSDFNNQQFGLTLTGTEFFIKDHVINGKRLLPAVAYCEAVRIAATESVNLKLDENSRICLRNITWLQPVIVEQTAKQLLVELFEEDDHSILFEIVDASSERALYSQGIITIDPAVSLNVVDVNASMASATAQWDKASCYPLLRGKGYEYGPAHQVIDRIYSGEEQYLAKISLPTSLASGAPAYYLHPAIMDGVLQAALLTVFLKSDKDALYLPFTIDEMQLIAPGTRAMWAVIYSSASKAGTGTAAIQRFDIDVCDEEGRICVRMKGMTFKRTARETIHNSSKDLLLFAPSWIEQQAQKKSAVYGRHLLFICEPDNCKEEELRQQLPGVQIVLLQGAQNNIAQRYIAYARRLFEEVQTCLLERPDKDLLIQVAIFDRADDALFAGLAGLLKTVSLENPYGRTQLLRLSSTKEIVEKVYENMAFAEDAGIRYIDGQRHIAGWKELAHTQGQKDLRWRDQGVYLITGGTGALGLVMATEIVQKARQVTLVLTGRSPLDDEKSRQIEKLHSDGARVIYKQVDVADKRAVATLINDIETGFGALHGIIHCAGIVKDNFIIKKSKEELATVLAPKVLGATWLDEATKDLPLDLFIVYSSVVGALGNAGQADYAAANAWLDGFAGWRNGLVQRSERQGHTLSINWPLWENGGMRPEADMVKEFVDNMGMGLLQTAAGVEALYQAFASGEPQVLVAPGDVQVLRKKFLTQAYEKPLPLSVAPIEHSVVINNRSHEKVEQYFKELLSDTIKRPVEQIAADAAMEEYGIDSIMVMQMTRELEKVFGALPKTLFFEYQNIQELTEYFLKNHSGKLSSLLQPTAGDVEGGTTEEESAPVFVQVPFDESPLTVPQRRGKRSVRDNGAATSLDIAVVGVAGRYPGADNLKEFWDNLVHGKDSITEIPADRWDYRLQFDPDKTKEGKSYSKWGGFLRDVDKFDPLFFNISPVDAERMDPQERLFLQCVYETIEDAGYTRQTLTKQKQFGLGNMVGVFVGVMYEEYQLLGAQETLYGRPVALWGLPSSIANRVSYFCDFHGPSMAVDTMCSSSLTAIHLACESIVRGKCEVAIAGGVNVSVHPNKYLFLSQGKFASSKGRCESFGAGGDGYVPGEGVGAVLLKPLQNAIADGDNIYGVIKATAVNHGGKTNGYTVPNPNAQAAVIGRAFKESGINARAISYLEAHGTGTSLGDPIEIAGLSKAIGQFTADKQFCAIGSVKSNIGHCESAAGIAGLTKVLLQLKHKKIVPSLHAATLNAHIDFAESPFVVQQRLTDWKKPVVETNGQHIEYPRYAGISSFGAGGANAHIVLGEYVPKNEPVRAEQGRPVLIVLSAVDEDRLKEKVKQVLAVVAKPADCPSLSDISYTLQVGREHFEYRLAMVVHTMEELHQKLQAFIQGPVPMPGLFYGHATSRKNEQAAIDRSATDRQAEQWLKEKQFEKLGALWVKGSKVDWMALYRDDRNYRRISLPGYPFRKERYWIGEAPGNAVAFQTGSNQRCTIHPLLHENIADITGQRFRVTFTGSEFYLEDHRVKGQKILPAVAYLEMIREAVWQSVKSFGIAPFDIRIMHTKWLQPLLVEEPGKEIEIELYADENGSIVFEIYANHAEDPDEREIFCTGEASIETATNTAGAEEVGSLRQACNERVITKSTIYELFGKAGFQYGPVHQALSQVYIGHHKLLAQLTYPSLAFDQQHLFVLHPALMDAALQASLLYNATTDDQAIEMYLPVAVESVEMHRRISPVAWVTINPATGAAPIDGNGRLLNIDILTDSGEYCVRMKGVRFQRTSPSWSGGPIDDASFETVLLLPQWKEKAVSAPVHASAAGKHVIITAGLKKNEWLASYYPQAEIISLPTDIQDFEANAEIVFEKLKGWLKQKESRKIFTQLLVLDEYKDKLYTALAGLLKTAQKENPRFIGQLILINSRNALDQLPLKIEENSLQPGDKDVRYRQGRREVLSWEIDSTPPLQEAGHVWRRHGVYLITGGAGGLGLIFAHEIARQAAEVILVLTGRSVLTDSVRAQMAPLQQLGATVVYRQVDVTNAGQVEQLIQFIHSEYGNLNGIIHSAGVIRDNYLINKTTEEWNAVLAPKVKGVQYLDHASRNSALDLFIFFSSVSGALGNAGQGGYATANAFMDEYAAYRNEEVKRGHRQGHTLSINWPLWQTGGMHVNEEARRYLFDSMGMVPLPAADGIAAFYEALRRQCAQVMVIRGSRQQIMEKVILQPEPKQPEQFQNEPAKPAGEAIPEEAIGYLKNLFGGVMKLSAEKIRTDVPLEEYGIDSVMVMKLTGKLEKVFGPLSKTLFFEYQTTRELARYLYDEHRLQLENVCGLVSKQAPEKQSMLPERPKSFLELLRSKKQARRYFRQQDNKQDGQQSGKPSGPVDIAIVGIAGKYPQANNLKEFWDNLTKGKDCITEIPIDRWDHRLYFDADKKKLGKTYSKWGGFLQGVDEFDPLFFNISPREAELMDPQERLFLQCVYEAIEDAGYNRESLAAVSGDGVIGNVGVYAGVMYEEYQLFGAQESLKGNPMALFGNPSSIANRVSYYFNFNGPSMAIDTMCSSSLTAIHLACQAIHNGDCKAAIAGGVNISIHPNKYLLLAQGKFISGKGRCESFGIGGDGYVPAEGVGAVLLKPLQDALANGDHIYGVIKSTAVNHGGKTNGYTVPNPNAQSQVIKSALLRSGIDPRTISYVEAHGTGTSLGDPIEITGLQKAYSEFTKDKGFCAIGSVKSNIGHAESAAGIAALTKVILQLKHKKLAPSLHAETLNPHIDFSNSPFVVQQVLCDWNQPSIERNGRAEAFPRRAGISSFGAGGANAHLIIEEFEDKRAAKPLIKADEPVIITLSAKNEHQLQVLAKAMLLFVQQHAVVDEDLVKMAYTLHMGRESWETRLAMQVNSIASLTEKLEAFIKGEAAVSGIYYGKIERSNIFIDDWAADEELQEAVSKWIERRKYARLCSYWVKGIPINWLRLYEGAYPNGQLPLRMSLPVYPFAREKYWVPGVAETKAVQVPPDDLMTFEEVWTPQSTEEPIAPERAFPIKVIACFVPDAQLETSLTQAFKKTAPQMTVLFVYPKHSASAATAGYLLDDRSPSGYKELIKQITGAYGQIDAFIYLWAYNEAYAKAFHPIVYLLQAIGAEKCKQSKVLLAGAWNSNKPDAWMTRCYLESWTGFSRSLRLALPDNQVIAFYQELPESGFNAMEAATRFLTELQVPGNHEVLYKNGQRYSLQVRTSAIETQSSLIKKGGTYLITGGLGALGFVFAKHLAAQYGANLVLTGRAPLNAQKQQQIDELKAYGQQVLYITSDVCDRDTMSAGLATARERTGGFDGLIHAAGVEKAGTILDRSFEEFRSIMAAKVDGTILLDQLLQDDPLQFACYFSSSAAILGDFGSCDYAIGNRFQMAVAAHLPAQQAAGKPRRKTIAINWPLWRDGGMNLQQPDNTNMYLASSGQRYLETKEGLDIFDRLLNSAAPSHQLIIAGTENKVHQFLRMTPAIQKNLVMPAPRNLTTDLVQWVSQLLKIPAGQIDVHVNLADLGFDSVTLTQFADTLSHQLGIEVAPALFFSYSTIQALTNYFESRHIPIAPTVQQTVVATEQLSRPFVSEPVAIIGMSGKFPQARNIEEMWHLLAEGKEAVTEIPADRFDWRVYYSGPEVEEGKTNCKWTGIMPGIAEFDPLFFEISPAEAREMDPRQRLLLQEGWKALEDAGYGPTHLKKNKIGLFVGVEEGNYAGLSTQPVSITSNHNAILAARLSYFLNLSGPNMAINTACSSGLVALHQAFQSLQNDECDTAMAASVNVMLSPEPYVMMSQAGMLSEDGRCHTFDKKANGMVPGEAVVVLVLKKLSKAIADGDPIYATITGSGINYDGKTNGITAPGGLAQTELLHTVYDKYGVNPEQIEYIVTHGTGTRLGDPVEINALYEAFTKYTNKQQYCALTSCKTNFGHTFAASGLVSVVNLVQAMRAELIPPSLHCKEENDYIMRQNSPFFINTSLRSWPAVNNRPRMGAVSAFGMSGTNAHVVIQSYEGVAQRTGSNRAASYLFPFSAKTPEALRQKMGDFRTWLEQHDAGASTMNSIAYTLMTGRQHFRYRCAIVARNKAEVLHLLDSALRKEKHAHCYWGEVTSHTENGHTALHNIQAIIQEQEVDWLALAKRYCEGQVIGWDTLFVNEPPSRIHLPAYPFSEKNYWIRDEVNTVAATTKDKKWLFVGEEWIASPATCDLTTCLRKYAGKQICVVYKNDTDWQSFKDTLMKVSSSIIVKPLHVSQVDASMMKAMQPAIVLVLDGAAMNPVPARPIEENVQTVFEVSRSLMESMWDEPVRLYFIYTSSPAAPRLGCEAVSGLVRSAMKENDMHRWKLIRVCEPTLATDFHQILLREMCMDEDAQAYAEVKYDNGKRYLLQLTETNLPVPNGQAFRQHGNYIIAGGTGFIGSALLEQLATKYKANLYILSRTAYNEAIEQQCDRLRQLGATVTYLSADVTNENDLQAAYKKIKMQSGPIHGVVNLVRAHDTKIIAAKTWQSFHAVSLVKVLSTSYLDELTRSEPLDFFMMFSSMSAFGASGESDYGYSCAFQNAFAVYRNRLVKEGKRSGMAVAHCWGPWTADRLFPGHTEKWAKFGCDFIDMDSAFPLIEATSAASQAVIGINAVTDADIIKRWFGIKTEDENLEKLIQQWEQQKKNGNPPDANTIRQTISVQEMDTMDASLVERIYNLCFEQEATPVPSSPNLRQVIEATIKEVLEIDRVNDHEPFQQYGLDSIKTMKLCARLRKKLNMEVRPQWFIECQTINELSKYLYQQQNA